MTELDTGGWPLNYYFDDESVISNNELDDYDVS